MADLTVSISAKSSSSVWGCLKSVVGLSDKDLAVSNLRVVNLPWLEFYLAFQVDIPGE